MTKAEREIVMWAITELMAEDGKFHEAMHRLCKLVGWEYPAYAAMKAAKAVPLRELLASKEEDALIANIMRASWEEEADRED